MPERGVCLLHGSIDRYDMPADLSREEGRGIEPFVVHNWLSMSAIHPSLAILTLLAYVKNRKPDVIASGAGNQQRCKSATHCLLIRRIASNSLSLRRTNPTPIHFKPPVLQSPITSSTELEHRTKKINFLQTTSN